MDWSAFQHSLFLNGLGSAIVNSLWQSFLLWIIYQMIIIFKKNISAKLKHNLSLLSVSGSFAWFLITLFSKVYFPKTASIAPEINNFQNISSNNSIFNSLFSFSASVLPYLSVAYILLLFFLMIKLFSAYKHVHFIARKNLTVPSQYLLDFSEKVALRLQIGRKIKVWVSGKIQVPATIGFIKPVILIPLASINNLSVEQLEAIILHEFSHIKRNDYLINLWISFVETFLFFNPFIAYFIKTIKQERENCCDDLVLQYRYDPHSYASALLNLEQTRNQNLQLALGAVSGKKELLARIKRITGTSTDNHFSYIQKVLALFVTTAIFCCLGWISSIKDKKEIAIKKVVVEQKSNKSVEQILNKSKSEESIITVNTNKTAKVVDKSKKSTAEKSKRNNFSAKPESNITVDLKNISINLGDFDFGQEVEKGLKQAYIEINNINWSDVQKDIKNSFEDMNLESIPSEQREALLLAKKYVSTMNLEKPRINAEQIQKELKKNQKLLDSLMKSGSIDHKFQSRAAADGNRTKARAVITNNPSEFFVYGFNNKSSLKETEGKTVRKPEAPRSIQIFQRNTEPVAPKQPSQFERDVIRKINTEKRIIIEI